MSSEQKSSRLDSNESAEHTTEGFRVEHTLSFRFHTGDKKIYFVMVTLCFHSLCVNVFVFFPRPVRVSVCLWICLPCDISGSPFRL